MTILNLMDQLQVTNRAFTAALMRGDAAGMADAHTEYGQLLPAHSAIVVGRSAIQRFWQNALETLGLKGAELETLEVRQYGHTAYEAGRYTLNGAKGKVLDQGKYVVIWKQGAEGGSGSIPSSTAVCPDRNLWKTTSPYGMVCA